MQKFRKGEVRVLVATDVASRGLDISSLTLKTVINFEVSKDKASHAHRVGRTGRAGVTEDCVAYTILTKNQHNEASMLIQALEESNQTVSRDLEILAGNDPKFKKKRTTIIGLGKFKMEIDIGKETEKVRKEMRKIGDRSGIGCSNDTVIDQKEKNPMDNRVVREAQLLLSGRGDLV